MVFLSFFLFWAALISLGFNQRRPLIAKFIVAIGGASLMAAAISYCYTRHFVSHAQRTSGTIVEMRNVTDAENTILSYAIIFRFADASGLPHTASSASGGSFREGDCVGVLYPVDDPQNARIDTYWQVWREPSLFGICGGIELLVGLLAFYWRAVKWPLGHQPR